MNPIKNIIKASLFASALALTTQSASAVSPNFPAAAIAKINSDGFQICKALGSRGFTATARGTVESGGRGSSRYFQVRTCFESASNCQHFINRIHHSVGRIDELRYAACSSRS